MVRKYLYGVIRNTGATRFGPIGLETGQEQVYVVGLGPIAAVVSDYRGIDLERVPRHELLRLLVLHQKVIETVMQDHTVLPAKFGTVLPGATELRRAMRCGAPQLAQALDSFDGLVQLEVAATWELQPLFDEIAQEEEIARLRAAASAASPSDSLALCASVGAMIKESLDRRREEFRRRLTSLLAGHALDHQSNALMGDEMVMNAAFLVARSAQEQFLDRLHEADLLFDSKLNLRCIGPLPPYSFATVEIVRPGPAEVDAALQLLGLGHRISASLIRRAYRDRAARLHPDVNSSPEATDRFSQLRGAESLLVAYCSMKATGDGSRADSVCRVSRGEVERSYLVDVRRSGGEANYSG